MNRSPVGAPTPCSPVMALGRTMALAACVLAASACGGLEADDVVSTGEALRPALTDYDITPLGSLYRASGDYASITIDDIEYSIGGSETYYQGAPTPPARTPSRWR